jgi:hypothetical protein
MDKEDIQTLKEYIELLIQIDQENNENAPDSDD